ncbi:alcohol dehydrogenase GroES-like domain-containing protein [Colletotrichum graminicola]|nr:alcohol dehydrogenase GroES-like domain-containing protein [Colletotrichum graminicola]
MGCLNQIKALFATSSKPPHQTRGEKNIQVTPKQSNNQASINTTTSSVTMSSSALPKTYKQASFKELGGDLVLEEVPLQLPAAGEILVKVEACGVCHSDVFAKYNAWGAGFPMVPGHEIIGKVAALGDGVSGWTVGDRIGGAWHGGHDGTCAHCQSGLYQFCEPYVVTGVTKNGGCE